MPRRRMTIDELSQTTGVSSRNIRYYQTRGLLPSPRVEGRTGYYDQAHVERLSLIQELQSEGLNLQAIGWLLGGAASVDSDEVRRLKRSILDRWIKDEPVEVPAEEVERLVEGDDADRELAERAIELGLLADTDDPDRWRVLLPTVLAAGREVTAMGVPAARTLDVLETMRDCARQVAAAYLEIFDEAVLAPWDARGRPAGEWADIRAAVDRIRPLAGEALLAVFQQAMVEAVEELLAETVSD